MDSSSAESETEWKFQIVVFGKDNGENKCYVRAKLVGPHREVEPRQLDCVLETNTHKLMSLTMRFDGWLGAIPDEEDIFDFSTIPVIPSQYQSLIESGLYLRGRSSLNKDWELSVRSVKNLEKAKIIEDWFRRITNDDSLEFF